MGYIFLPILNLACKLFNAKASHVKVFMQEIFISSSTLHAVAVSKAYKLDCNYRNLIFFKFNTNGLSRFHFESYRVLKVL